MPHARIKVHQTPVSSHKPIYNLQLEVNKGTLYSDYWQPAKEDSQKNLSTLTSARA